MSKEAKVEYKYTEFYIAKNEYILKWNDNKLEIKWPIKSPIVSKKDNLGLTLKEINF
jgi:dTDP-4-dehydrorhamnose 3,5-epimerase